MAIIGVAKENKMIWYTIVKVPSLDAGAINTYYNTNFPLSKTWAHTLILDRFHAVDVFKIRPQRSRIEKKQATNQNAHNLSKNLVNGNSKLMEVRFYISRRVLYSGPKTQVGSYANKETKVEPKEQCARWMRRAISGRALGVAPWARPLCFMTSAARLAGCGASTYPFKVPLGGCNL